MEFMLISTLYYVKQESTVYQGSKMPDGIDRFKYYNHITTLASNESEDPEFNEWITHRLKAYALTPAE